jgi:hypothetical protein
MLCKGNACAGSLAQKIMASNRGAHAAHKLNKGIVTLFLWFNADPNINNLLSASRAVRSQSRLKPIRQTSPHLPEDKYRKSGRELSLQWLGIVKTLLKRVMS